MTRFEMLTELTDLLADTAGISSGDFLASDTRKYAYLSEGQEKFCEDTGYFIDNTTFTIATVAGTEVYAVDERIIKVLEVWESGRILTPYQQTDRPLLFGTEIPSVSNTTPAYWQMDEQTGQIRFWPTPNDVYTMSLRSWRYPLLDLEGGGQPEIPATLHRACIEWAAYKILNHHDAELRNKAKAGEHYEAYQMYVDRGIKLLRRRKGTQSYMGCQLMYQVR